MQYRTQELSPGRARRREERIARRRSAGHLPQVTAMRASAERTPWSFKAWREKRKAARARSADFLTKWWKRISAARAMRSANGTCEYRRVFQDPNTKRFQMAPPCGGTLKPITRWYEQMRVRSLRCQLCGREVKATA